MKLSTFCARWVSAGGLALLLAGPAARAGSELAGSGWAQSVVTVEVARQQYDFFQPWSKRTRRLQKSGLVVRGRQILTTAQDLQDRTLVRLQKNGRGRWAVAEVAWIDYYANLAVLTTTDTNFWLGLKPAPLGGQVSAAQPLQILRWREGNLETRRAEFSQYTVREGQLCSLNQPLLETSTDLEDAGWGEPIISRGKVVGLAQSEDGRNCTAVPAAFISRILEARQKNAFRGLGHFPFFWQPAENPATLARLGLSGEPRGVLITQVPAECDTNSATLQRDDVLLRIENFPIESDGGYADPDYGHVILENLALRCKWAGETLQMQVWRTNHLLNVTYTLPRFDFTNSLVPAALFDREPEFLIVGGLVFQPLTETYLQSWGAEWRRRAPFRLRHYASEPATGRQPGLVILSQVLPDAYNIGYQELRGLVVEKVNGQPISRLADLQQALEKSTNGFHVVEFVQGDGLRKLVLASGFDERYATQRVLRRYGITQAAHLEK